MFESEPRLFAEITFTVIGAAVGFVSTVCQRAKESFEGTKTFRVTCRPSIGCVPKRTCRPPQLPSSDAAPFLLKTT